MGYLKYHQVLEILNPFAKLPAKKIILIEHITLLIYNSSVITYEYLKSMSNCRELCSNGET